MFSETLKQSILQLVRRRRRSYSHETRGLKRLPLLKIELFLGFDDLFGCFFCSLTAALLLIFSRESNSMKPPAAVQGANFHKLWPESRSFCVWDQPIWQ